MNEIPPKKDRRPPPVQENPSSQPVHDSMESSQTRSEQIAVVKAQAGADHERPESPNPAAETESVAERLTEHPIGAAVAASETQIPVDTPGALEGNAEGKRESQTGEKRNRGSTATPGQAPGPESTSENKDKAAPEKSDGPGKKKQKTESKPAGKPSHDATDFALGVTTDAAASQTAKKSAQPKKEKKEKAREAGKKATPKKITPTNGVSSRTRSRTKST